MINFGTLPGPPGKIDNDETRPEDKSENKGLRNSVEERSHLCDRLDEVLVLVVVAFLHPSCLPFPRHERSDRQELD
eukprot:2314381-Rhodomonas_salina.3